MMYFLKVIFSLYVLICAVTCFICSIALHLLSSSVFLCHPHWCVYFQILYTTMNFYEWKLNLTWRCKWIICKRITEHICWRVGLLLTHQSFAGVMIPHLKSRYLENRTLFFLKIKIKKINCMWRFICSIALCLLSSSVFLCHPHWCVYFQILYTTMNLYE